MTAAHTVDARRRCVDSELEIHDDALNAAYAAAFSTLPAVDQGVLRVLQRQWIGQRDSRCPQGGDAAAQLDAQQCRAHMTLLHARQLQGGGAASTIGRRPSAIS